MVNEEKVHIMTQIALDETKNYKEQINEGGYFKSDYIRSHIISVIWNVSISYLLVLFLIALYYSDYLFVNVVRLNYAQMGIIIIGVYFILLVVTIFFSYFYYLQKYVQNQEAIRDYLGKLKALEDFYIQSKEASGDDTITGA